MASILILPDDHRLEIDISDLESVSPSLLEALKELVVGSGRRGRPVAITSGTAVARQLDATVGGALSPVGIYI